MIEDRSRDRFSEQKPLAERDARLAQRQQVLFALHTLGDHRGNEVAGDLTDGPDDRVAIAVGRAAEDEVAIDLQTIRTGIDDHPEVAVAEAHVVHRDAHAELSEAPDRVQQTAGIEVRRLFDELDHQPLQIELVRRGRRLDVQRKRRIALQGRGMDVHMHGDVLELHRGGQGRSETTAVEAHFLALEADVVEQDRRALELPSRRPSRERFHRADHRRLAGEVDDRLEDHPQASRLEEALDEHVSAHSSLRQRATPPLAPAKPV